MNEKGGRCGDEMKEGECTYPGGKPGIPGKGGKGAGGKPPGGGGPPGKKGGGALGGIIIAGGGIPGAGAGGAEYACGGAPYTPPVLESAVAGVEDESAPPMSALCASSCALSSSSVSGRFSVLGRLAGGWEMDPAERPSSISLRRL
jgi:hypothetical protein